LSLIAFADLALDRLHEFTLHPSRLLLVIPDALCHLFLPDASRWSEPVNINVRLHISEFVFPKLTELNVLDPVLIFNTSFVEVHLLPDW
jgi:hypothetical protein